MLFQRVIDYLKLDLRGEEWPVLRHLVDSGLHSQIKQIGVDFHTPRLRVNPVTNDPEDMSVLDYGEIWQTLHDLEGVGFQQFSHEALNCCGIYANLTSSEETFGGAPQCCYRTAYVNTAFMDPGLL